MEGFAYRRRQILELVKTELAGQSVLRPDIGLILFTYRGLKHLLSRIGGPNALAQLESVLQLREGVEQGTYIGQALPYPHTHPEAKAFHYIDWETLDGLKLRITIKELKARQGGTLFVYAQHEIVKNGR